MKLSAHVIDYLSEQKITHIFEVCGGALAHLLDSLYGRTDITTVSMHHEMAAAIAAEGYARASENFGVAMATSGPGATNLITGIGSCYFDSIPCMFITGQVNTYEYKYLNPVRQNGFQETDIVSIVTPIVKKAVMVDNPENITCLLEHLIDEMKTRRNGPVLMDIPLDIQRADIDVSNTKNKHPLTKHINLKIPSGRMDAIHNEIDKSTRPIILSGGGVRSSHSCELLSTFAHKYGIPVVTSLMGLDSFPHDDPLFCGMIGTYGNRYANLAIANSDLVIVLGSRLDSRQTGTSPETFARKAVFIHVDIDAAEIHNKISPLIAIHADINAFLTKIIAKKYENKNNYTQWLKKIGDYKQQYPSYIKPSGELINPNHFIHCLSKTLPDDAIICVDVGQTQMWSAQSTIIKGTQRFLTQGGMASIGSALPLAIGAAFAKPNQQIIAITGDGGFQLNIQELQTVFHYDLPIKIVMLNNNGYGLIKQFQEQYMESRFQSSGIGFSNPDFQNVVGAYKIKTNKITTNNEINKAIKTLLIDMKPGFLEVIIDPTARALPKLSVNQPIEDQEPLVSREELQKNMIIDMLRS